MRLRNSAFFTAALITAAVLFTPLNARAGININIGVNLAPAPPVYVIHEPPSVIVIPGTYVYFVPGIGVDILFYHGYWYRPYREHWYRSRGYNGPWHHVYSRKVPYTLRHLPRDYRHAARIYRPVPFRQMTRNWRKWEKERYWDSRRIRHDRKWRRDKRRENRREHHRYEDRDRGRDHD